jgi:hypothetical protein
MGKIAGVKVSDALMVHLDEPGISRNSNWLEGTKMGL